MELNLKNHGVYRLVVDTEVGFCIADTQWKCLWEYWYLLKAVCASSFLSFNQVTI